MFTLDQLFDQIFPWLSGISWDIGTLLTGLIFLSFIALGFDWVMQMFGMSMERRRYNSWSERYYSAAEEALDRRGYFEKGSSEWLKHDMMYKELLRKSAKSQVKGWDW